jgi:transposase-like protein|tara:strand:+ start:162 stop:440 length:279 start_codon:yes stop_codon:yes gene_type:complete
MPRKRFSVEQIINHLREAEVLLAQGQTVGEICRHIGVSEQSYYRWRREYGGLKIDQARRLKELERENGRLRRAIADLTLEKLVLKEAAEGNF